MQSQPVQTVQTARPVDPFKALPTELLLEIFCHLPLLSDVFALRANCKRAKDIWEHKAAEIYLQVGPRSIPCELQARSFLACKDGPALESPTNLTCSDVFTIARNSVTVEKALCSFESEVFRKSGMFNDACRTGILLIWTYVDDADLSSAIVWSNPRLSHGPYLVRYCYRFWELISLEQTEWKRKLEILPVRELWILIFMYGSRCQYSFPDSERKELLNAQSVSLLGQDDYRETPAEVWYLLHQASAGYPAILCKDSTFFTMWRLWTSVSDGHIQWEGSRDEWFLEQDVTSRSFTDFDRLFITSQWIGWTPPSSVEPFPFPQNYQ